MTQSRGFVEECKKNLVYSQTKSLYGLKHASSYWYKQIEYFIASLRFYKYETNNFAFIYDCGNRRFIILLFYVDNMFIASTSKYDITTLKTQLAKEFDIKDLGVIYQILGMKVQRDKQ